MKNKIYIVVGAVLIFILIGSYFLLNNPFSKTSTEEEYLKNYKVNEYIPTYVSDEDMANIYLNDYVYFMFYNQEEAYNLLDEEYRNKRFGNLNNFIQYIKTSSKPTYKMTKYYKKNVDGHLFFGVYDQNGNFFGFKTDGVMQYTVYLDETTVEI